MIIYGLKNCDSCRKARKALPEARFVDLREERLPDEVLRQAVDTFGDRLVNTRSTTWRELQPEERSLSPEVLVAAHPAVMKRPLIVDEARMVLGWDDATRAELGVN